MTMKCIDITRQSGWDTKRHAKLTKQNISFLSLIINKLHRTRHLLHLLQHDLSLMRMTRRLKLIHQIQTKYNQNLEVVHHQYPIYIYLKIKWFSWSFCWMLKLPVKQAWIDISEFDHIVSYVKTKWLLNTVVNGLNWSY